MLLFQMGLIQMVISLFIS